MHTTLHVHHQQQHDFPQSHSEDLRAEANEVQQQLPIQLQQQQMAQHPVVPFLAHALAIGTPLLLSVTFFSTSLFSLHVAAMSITYLLLLPEGALLAVMAFKNKQRIKLMTNHFLVQLGAMLLALTGLGAIFFQRYHRSKPHFNTFHSWLGVATLALTELLAFVGLLMYYGLRPSSRSTSSLLHSFHRFGGRLVLIMGVMTICSALHVFNPQHPRHKGWVTYAIVCAMAAQVTGLASAFIRQVPARNFGRAAVPSSSGAAGAATAGSIGTLPKSGSSSSIIIPAAATIADGTGSSASVAGGGAGKKKADEAEDDRHLV